MKSTRRHIVLLIAALLLLTAGSAWAKGLAGVKNTLHNLSTSAPIIGFTNYRSTESEICVFCHTPHGGRLEGPLWNRSVGVAPTGWTHYNSATLSTHLKDLPANRVVNDESLLCMSCHDGSISVMHLINPTSAGQPIHAGTLDPDVEIQSQFDGSPGAKIGGARGNAGAFGDLSDDHPISFSYQLVLASPEYQAGGGKENHLRPIGATNDANSALGWKGEGVRFFGGAEYRVECSSCHDPHVDYESGINNPKNYDPFLIRPNTGSDLCLACHNK